MAEKSTLALTLSVIYINIYICNIAYALIHSSNPAIVQAFVYFAFATFFFFISENIFYQTIFIIYDTVFL